MNPPFIENDNKPKIDPNGAASDWLTYRRFVIAELEYLRSRFDYLEKNYVKQSEFFPIKVFIYSVIGIVMTSVFAALLALVIQSKLL